MLLQVNPLSLCNHLRKQHPSVNDGHKLVSLNVSNRSSPFKSTIPIIPILFGFIVVAVVGVRTIGIVATVARGWWVATMKLLESNVGCVVGKAGHVSIFRLHPFQWGVFKSPFKPKFIQSCDSFIGKCGWERFTVLLPSVIFSHLFDPLTKLRIVSTRLGNATVSTKNLEFQELIVSIFPRF